MLCYFDSNTDVNLSHITDIKQVRPLEELKKRLSESNFEFAQSTEYSQLGLYIVEVSKIPSLWCAKTKFETFNLLLNIPSRVIKAAKSKKIRILVLSIVEGDNFTSNNFDGFEHLHNTVRLLGLPKHAVLIVSGNLNARQQYTEWCKQHSKEEYIEFQEGIEWDGKTSNNGIRSNAPIKITEHCFPFNSLNRAHRNHRTEHLYFLAENKLTGLVSGGAWFATHPIDLPIYQTVDYNHYKAVLTANYPKTVDVSDLINQVPNLINNLEIYERSQLTVVTESHFDQTGGLFITEKTFRPLLVGHPFMILGQRGTLKKLRSWGFQTDFDGIDQSYDDVADDSKRFAQFHQSLKNWYYTPLEEKKLMLQKWESTIKHNFNHYNIINFKKSMFDCAIESSNIYFKEYS
jgi:hypothetical protein